MYRPLRIAFLMPLGFYAIFFVQAQAQTTGISTNGNSTAGHQLFSSTCAACHGLDGRGGEHAPNIATDASIQRLSDNVITQIVKNGIPAGGMPAFKESFTNDQIQVVVTYLRELQGKGAARPVSGDAKRGESLFYGSGRCSDCHMVNGRGGFLGADLSGYGQTHSATDCREAIIHPDKNLKPDSGTISVVTRKGKKYAGLIRNEDNFSLQMQTGDGAFRVFEKAELAEIDRQMPSLMPSDYGTKLTSTQLDDLISYLNSAPNLQSPASDKEAEQ